MAMKDKSKGRRYTKSEQARALQIYREYGPTIAAQRMGIPYETVRRWAKVAGENPPTTLAHVANAHAAAAVRTAGKWADVRESEADSAGQAARIARERILDLVITDDHQMLRAAVNAYEVLINKAEMLSGQATERIAIWAEQDIDRELRDLVKTLEAEKRQLPPPVDENEVIIEVVAVDDGGYDPDDPQVFEGSPDEP
jgi:transposase-like protein